MSVKELFTYSDSSQLNINTIEAKSMTLETQNIETLTATTVDAVNVNSLNAIVETLTATGNTSVGYMTAYQTRYNTVVPSVVNYKIVNVVTNAISTLNATQMAGGVVLGNGSEIFKSNIDTAANLFSQVPLINGQAIEFLCVNKSAFQWNFDLLDPVNVTFNQSGSAPSIAAGSQRYVILFFTGSPSSPSYIVYM